MVPLNYIAIFGMIFSAIVTIIIIYNYCKTNINSTNRRRNRISPEMFQVLANIILERNREQAIRNYETEQKEIELTKMKDKYKVIIINPDDNISLGSKN